MSQASDETIAFYTKLSDTVLLCVAVLPLLSLLAHLIEYLLKMCCGSDDGAQGGEGGMGALSKDERRARDIEEEASIKQNAIRS